MVDIIFERGENLEYFIGKKDEISINGKEYILEKKEEIHFLKYSKF